MVLGRGNKNSPAREAVRPQEDITISPPPYEKTEFTAPIVLAGTTTTTRTEVVTTTTQTTTHFFSLPLWRKRPSTASSSTRPSTSTKDQFGSATDGVNSASFMVEKDLPPTPVSHDSHGDTEEICSRESQVMNEKAEAIALGHRHSHSEPSDATPRKLSKGLPLPPQPTMALAQASLGLGLTHVIPQIASSTSSPDINTVAFTRTSLEAQASSMRRAKSSTKITAALSSDEPIYHAKKSLDPGEQRARAISTGTDSKQSNEKGKARADDNSTPSLARKSSFWSRKKKDTPPAALPLTSDRNATHHGDIPRSPTFSRSFSENSLHSSRQTDMETSQTVSRSKRSPRSPTNRPATADPSMLTSPRMVSFRPTTADGSSRNAIRLFSVDPSSPHAPPMKTSISIPDHSTPSENSLSSSPTRRRPRAQTNPPLLHRLSSSLFSPTAPKNSVFGPNMFTSSVSASNDSPRPSTNKKSVEVPKPQVGEESPDAYLERLLNVVSTAEIAGVLASSGDSFYVHALRSYIARFDFKTDPLDVALRKLLMEVGLPRETQQIDRVVEAFASQYMQSNPNLFASEDHPYILAFSLIMLHTDAFNKSNKRKMTKPGYIKNTRLPGVAPEVLDCFYDNIVFAPFIFIEDPLDINGQRGFLPEATSTQSVSKMGSQCTSPPNGSSATLLGKGSKIDPYFLITHNLLDPLRVPVEVYVPLENPYSYKGTEQSWDEQELHYAFARAAVIEVDAVDTYKVLSPFFGLTVGVSGLPTSISSTGAMPELLPATGEIWTLKVTKVGLLSRKDDTLEGGKKAANRKWKVWSVILTGSQLLLFRDSFWATSLLAQSDSPEGQVIYPQASLFKPDELWSVKDAIAVFDKSYTKYQNTLRFIAPDGRQVLLRTSDQRDIDEWISRINYASAFKSAGVRMRALGMSGKDVELTGVAAATSHLHDIQYQKKSPHKVRSWDTEAAHDLMDMLSGGNDSVKKKLTATRKVTMMKGQNDMDLDVPITSEIEGAHQFKVTFDQVKAKLAATNWSSSDDSSEEEDNHRANRLDSVGLVRGDCLPLPSRSHIIQSKVHDLESKITATQLSLDTDLRFVQNIATLTPFQKATRDRLQAAVQRVSKRIMQMRIELTKLTCHRDVLSGDLVAEARDMHRAKDLAFRAAAETLQSQHSTNVPHMTLSFHDEDNPPPHTPAASSHRPESSIADSFHSALDFGPDWPSSDDIAATGFLNASRVFDSPCSSTPLTPAGTYRSSGSYPFPEVDSVTAAKLGQEPSQASLPEKDDAGIHQETLFTAEEEAEEWNKTRAAKRVSLVRVPSNIRLTNRFINHSRQAGIDEDIAFTPDTTEP